MKKVYWTMKNGKMIDIDEMDINHLRNSLKLIVRAFESKKKEILNNQKNQFIGNIEMNFQEQMIQEEYYDDDFYEF